jgi:hypothetical protein
MHVAFSKQHITDFLSDRKIDENIEVLQIYVTVNCSVLQMKSVECISKEMCSHK